MKLSLPFLINEQTPYLISAHRFQTRKGRASSSDHFYASARARCVPGVVSVILVEEIVRLEIHFDVFRASHRAVALKIVVILHRATYEMVVSGKRVRTLQMKPLVGIFLIVQHSD